MKGDFTGFSFDGIHFDRMNVVRVSGGDRYVESILPEMEDNTQPIPGGDGEFYFGSYYRAKPIKIEVAFDSMSELDFRRFQKLLSTKTICPLIFDERPYKVYMAKISSPPELNYVCFDEPDFIWETAYQDEEHTIPYKGVSGQDFQKKVYTGKMRRVYRGDGSVEFTCTYPFAHSQFKTLDEYGDYKIIFDGREYENVSREIVPYGNIYTHYTNIDEWYDASGILPYELYTEIGIDKVDTHPEELIDYDAIIPVYNAGDIDAPYYLFIPYTFHGWHEPGTLDAGARDDNILLNTDDGVLYIKPFISKNEYGVENGIIINTRNHLIEGVAFNDDTQGWVTTGTIYNNKIIKGDFGTIKHRDFNNIDTGELIQMFRLRCANAEGVRIIYNYLYY